MAIAYEISTQAIDATFSAALGDAIYQMKLAWCNAQEGSWVLDIADNSFNALICGIPLVAGVDLLAQYRYLNIGGGGYLFVLTDGDKFAPPTKDNLGLNGHLMWQPFDG